MTNQTNKKYRIRNWPEYNKALVNRGSLTIWFSNESLERWNAEPSLSRGRPRVYLILLPFSGQKEHRHEKKTVRRKCLWKTKESMIRNLK